MSSSRESKVKENEKHLSGGMAMAGATKKSHKATPVELIQPGSFDADAHFYPRVLNAQIHPMMSTFLHMDLTRMMMRYTHLHPEVDKKALEKYLTYEPQYFKWAGADCFNVTEWNGVRQMVIVETNSCPSGQKSMPYPSDEDDGAGYNALLSSTFVPYLQAEERAGRLVQGGVLGVVYDKNYMEASGYAAELAGLTKEVVYLVAYHNDLEARDNVRWTEDAVLEVCVDDTWLAVRAAFRYVTQKPWNRIPVSTKTLILNPVVACLAGGRNKMMAAKAYDLFNMQLAGTGLVIRTPDTQKDVSLQEIPMWYKSMGGHMVVKVPYSNAGQGVYTITSRAELDQFMALEHMYDKFIIQQLVGNAHWSSRTKEGRYFHVGTLPDKQHNIYVADIRMMVGFTPGYGYRPIAAYGRRALKPLEEMLTPELSTHSWDMLGTNLSGKDTNGEWVTATNRLILMDRKDFNKLGIGIDDLIDAFVQTVLCGVSIDLMCKKLMVDGTFSFDIFASINQDAALLAEVNEGNTIV